MKSITYSAFLFFTSFIFAQENVSEAENLLQQQQITEAKLLLQEILASQPENEKAISLLGDIASFEKDWDKAINFYRTLVEKDPNNAEYNFKYGGALGMKALEVPRIRAVMYISDIKVHLEKAAKLDPQHVESRRALVELYMQLPMLLGGSQRIAETYASQLKNLSPVDFLLAKGFIYLEDEGAAEARHWFKKAFEAYEKISKKNRRNNINYELGKASGELNIYPAKGLKY